MREFRRYYWDSSVFCSFFSEEVGRCAIVEDLLREAHAGRMEIVTSSFTLVEVLRLKNHDKISQEAHEKLRLFFEYPFIKIVNADRDVCEAARNFVWNHGMAPKDAVHMATCESAMRVIEIHGLFSWDDDFVRLNEKTPVKVPISHPFMHQGILRLDSDFIEAPAEIVEREIGPD